MSSIFSNTAIANKWRRDENRLTEDKKGKK